uniref:BrnA antitoxin of type II toxin-antitoxin system n=1 Tax=Candidatus Kentrum sp. FW TaxID=2126338 RepID=A0A450RUD3_9GAMM|nr:MAG: BrnA antitoxin of type II toxin-antitoxin system [Candidatus Kentron sp. FW]
MRDEYDFSKAKRAGDVPHLVRLQNKSKGKTRITIMLDNDVLASFRKRAGVEGLGYQTLINQVLRANVDSRALDEETLRRVVREEMSMAMRASS